MSGREQRGDGRGWPRVIFARLARMVWYQNDRDDRATSSMAHVKKGGLPGERWNFMPRERGRLYGYFAPTGGRRCRPERILGVEDERDVARGVLVVFVAPEPIGQRVIGWYRDASVYDHELRGPGLARAFPCCYASSSRAVLLPTRERQAARWQVPARGKGGMATAKIMYLDPESNWMRRIVDAIASYDGPSIHIDRAAELEGAAVDVGEALAEARGGFQDDPRIRRAVERLAVDRAVRAYRADGYAVEEAGSPYDLHCKHRQTGRELWVEVKGTQGDGNEVLLTGGEVRFYRSKAPRAELFIVHGVRVTRGRASGGKVRRVERWRVTESSLTALAYQHRVPTGRPSSRA